MNSIDLGLGEHWGARVHKLPVSSVDASSSPAG